MNYISLGYFCSVASELEILGLRNESFPFDWVTSDFEGVMCAIENGFVDFLNSDYLAQSKTNHEIYKNTKYNISFFHDFDKYISLKKQLPEIQKKYNRRIERFYTSITHPTCFIRYISDEKVLLGRSAELIYIENNYEHILSVLKSFNRENNIIFIANIGVQSDKLSIYHVEKDENDVVARLPLHNNPDLFNTFSNLDTPTKRKNLDRYQWKEKKRKNIFLRIRRRVVRTFKQKFMKEFIYDIQF